MGGIFDIDSPLMQFLGKAADLLILSLLWLAGCLPLITIGTSTTALYYASIKAVREEGSPAKNFVKSFKENWKQSVMVELILLAAAWVFYIDVQLIFQAAGTLAEVLRILFVSLIFLYLALVSYIFPLLARFVYTLRALFRNAFLMSVLHLPYTFVIIALNLSPLILFLLRPDWFFRALPLILFLAPGLIAYVNSMLFLRIFKRYMPKE